MNSALRLNVKNYDALKQLPQNKMQLDSFHVLHSAKVRQLLAELHDQGFSQLLKNAKVDEEGRLEVFLAVKCNQTQLDKFGQRISRTPLMCLIWDCLKVKQVLKMQLVCRKWYDDLIPRAFRVECQRKPALTKTVFFSQQKAVRTFDQKHSSLNARQLRISVKCYRQGCSQFMKHFTRWPKGNPAFSIIRRRHTKL